MMREKDLVKLLMSLNSTMGELRDLFKTIREERVKLEAELESIADPDERGEPRGLVV